MIGLLKTSDFNSRMIKTYPKRKHIFAGRKIRKHAKKIVNLDIVDFCIDCKISNMSCPMGSFAAMKTRQNLDRMTIQRMQKEVEQEQYFKKYCMEPTPMKYSSKLMNSIWGMYNRYSVHNFKKNIDAQVSSVSVERQLF